jgi:hypothetical protein
MFDTIECAGFVEIHRPKFGPLYQFGGEAAAKLHHKEQHVVIGPTREEDLASI